MFKKNKWKLLLTSLMILIPMVVGLLLWEKLPQSIPTHWNVEGEVDGWANKAVAVFGMPLFILAVHWICLIVTAMDPKGKNVDGKALGAVLCICPIISLMVGTIMYATGLGVNVNVEIVLPLVLGAMFILIGNWLPKCKQNYTVGVRVSWALEDAENWRQTHRFAGIVYVVGGVIMMATALLQNLWIMLAAALVMAFAPMVYSYWYYRKHREKTL